MVRKLVLEGDVRRDEESPYRFKVGDDDVLSILELFEGRVVVVEIEIRI